MDQARITEWCASGSLPESDELFSVLTKPDGLFDEAEGSQWDFKDAWPYSLSDDYFAGIARLICAFSNTHGGIIVFGVHDTKRTGGHNKVLINLDKFSSAIRQLLGCMPTFLLQSYSSIKTGAVTVLMVSRRPDGTAPYRFQKTIGKYKANTIWCRVGHEVRVADPTQFPILFCRAQLMFEVSDERALDGSIPPSPATLKQKFVGRTEVLDQLFHWLEASDEPRTYLHGKGGSGKTTIAYEFARLIKENGGNLRIFGNDFLDVVIFVSAKEKSLHVADSKIIEYENKDFSNERELLEAILYFGGWTRDYNYLKTISIDKLRTELKDFFDITSVLIVIDDVDTLTTKGIDAGSDFLYRTLCRAGRSSKIVYTLRNAPSQSLGNATEVPGLSGDDYDQFVDECIIHFAVPAPTFDFRQKQLPSISERRPLVIESIIALRRTSGSYERATELFHQQTGDAIRDYVFLREWDALSSGNAKFLLAALSEFNEAASFKDLQSVLQFDQSAVSDAIGAVREMFLVIDEAGRDTLYALAPLTKAFITGKRSQLVGYSQLRERVKAFRRNVSASNPRVATIVSQVERLLPTRFAEHSSDKLAEAYRLVADKNHPPFVTEDPLYKSVVGYVLSCFSSSKLTETREAFKYAFSMNFEPDYKYLRAWYNGEKKSGINDGWCISIADFVLNGKRYTETEKLEMLGRKGTSLFARARERLYTDTSDALTDLVEALRIHLRAFRLYCIAGDLRSENSEKYARGTAFQIFNIYMKEGRPWEVYQLIETIAKGRDAYLDPLVQPIQEVTENVQRSSFKADIVGRTRQRLSGVADTIAHKDCWLSLSTRDQIIKMLAAANHKLDPKNRSITRN